MAQNPTATALQALKPREKPYKVTDGGGLFAEVLPTGSIVRHRQKTDEGKSGHQDHRPQQSVVEESSAARNAEIGPFLRALKADGGREENKLAIRLLMLTLVRKNELRLAQWEEVDLDNRVWTIPGHRMKRDEPHTVYWSTQAASILARLRGLAGDSPFVLHRMSTRSKPIGHTTLDNVIDRIDFKGARFVPHGFRATASTLLNEKGFRPDVIEKALAHSERNRIRGAYNKASDAHERSEMLQWWADCLDTHGF